MIDNSLVYISKEILTLEKIQNQLTPDQRTCILSLSVEWSK